MTWQRPLTDDELDTVITTIESADTPVNALIDGMTTFYDIALADSGSSFAAEPSIYPMEYRIPEDQWRTICKAFARADDTATLALEWVNRGPSAYQP